MSKNVCIDDKIIIGGVDVSDYVSAVDTHHHVGDLVSVTVTFQGVRIDHEETAETQPLLADDGSQVGQVTSYRLRHRFNIAEG